MSLPSLADSFPIEIYDSIISFVAGQDDALMSSIKSCALTSREFLSLARDHLFEHIWLNFNGIGAESFVRLVLQNPEIAQHVRWLNYRVKASDFAIQGLTDTLRMLSRLRCLEIDYSDPQITQRLEWSEVPLPLRIELLHRPTLARLGLWHIRNLHLSDLAMCSNLEYLSTQDVTLASTPFHGQTKTLQLKKYSTALHENDITNQLSTARNTNGTHVIDFSTLQSIKLIIERDISTSSQGTYQALFKRCTQVKRLVVLADEGFSKPFTLQGFANMILPSLQTLQYLEFTCLGSRLDDYRLAAEFEMIPRGNIIEKIAIEVCCYSSQYHIRGDKWAAFDRALTRDPSKWRNLKTVSLQLAINEWSSRDNIEEALRKLPETELKGLTASTVIHFNYKVTNC